MFTYSSSLQIGKSMIQIAIESRTKSAEFAPSCFDDATCRKEKICLQCEISGLTFQPLCFALEFARLPRTDLHDSGPPDSSDALKNKINIFAGDITIQTFPALLFPILWRHFWRGVRK